LAGRGFAAELRGDTIRVSPASQLTDTDRQAIRTHKAELIALLRPASVPAPKPFTFTERPRPVYLPCSCPTGICWPCHNRPCEMCGKPTGSAFISQCLMCEQLPVA
jgi:hypothetical protein